MAKKNQEPNWSSIGFPQDEDNDNNNGVDNTVNNNDDSKNAIKKDSKKDSMIDSKNDSAINSNNNVAVAIDNVFDNVLIPKGQKGKKVFHGVYFDEDVSKAINRISEKNGKGAKSKLINDIMKAALQQKGLL